MADFLSAVHDCLGSIIVKASQASRPPTNPPRFKVKKPEESGGPWDYYRWLDTVPDDQAFRPMAEGNCPMVR